MLVDQTAQDAWDPGGWGRTYDLAGTGRYIEESGVIMACPREVEHASGLHWECGHKPTWFVQREAEHVLIIRGYWDMHLACLGIHVLTDGAHLEPGVKALAYMVHLLPLPA
jgi:hypothetical protein